MVWACAKNGSVLNGQKGVNGESKWRSCMIRTEVGLDGWCEGGFGQLMNDGEGCATMGER